MKEPRKWYVVLSWLSYYSFCVARLTVVTIAEDRFNRSVCFLVELRSKVFLGQTRHHDLC